MKKRIFTIFFLVILLSIVFVGSTTNSGTISTEGIEEAVTKGLNG
jgi:hypothetical protein